MTEYPTATRYDAGTTVELEAIPAKGYYFNGWTGINNENPAITVTITCPKNITANFAPILYSLNVLSNSDEMGMVSIEPLDASSKYTYGAEVTLDAVATEGYKFSHWNGDFEGSKNPATITIQSDATIIAAFVENKGNTLLWLWILLGLAIVVLFGIYIRRKSRVK